MAGKRSPIATVVPNPRTRYRAVRYADAVKEFADASAPRQRRSSARYRKNEASIVAATAKLLAGGGWGAVTFNAVARAAQLSVRPVEYRFGSRVELAVAVWEAALADPVAHALTGVQRLAGLDGSPAEPAAALADAMRTLSSPSDLLRAAAELLVVAHFHPSLSTAIRTRLRAFIMRPGDDPVQAAQRAYLSAIVLGSILTATRHAHRTDLARDWVGWSTLLLARVAAPRAVAAAPSGIDERETDPVLDAHDPRLNRLLVACLRVVSERGFDDATTRDIADASGFSEGLLFGRYPTKAALLIDAVTRLQTNALAESLERRRERIDRYGVEAAQAAELEAFFAPVMRPAQVIALEFERLGAHDALVRARLQAQFDQAIEAFHRGGGATPEVLTASVIAAFATGMGMILLAEFVPEAVDLPFSAIVL